MNVSLLEQTRCTKFFYSAEMTQKVLDLQENKKDLQVFGVPSLNDMIGGYDRKYPYHEEFEKVQWNPILILHSSGSTGLQFLPWHISCRRLTLHNQEPLSQLK